MVAPTAAALCRTIAHQARRPRPGSARHHRLRHRPGGPGPL